MQKLHLKNPGYQYLETAFREWLGVLGYGAGTVRGMPLIVREFLHQLETQGVNHINQLQQKHIRRHHQYISARANQRRGGGLSNNYINKHLQAVEKFLEFLVHKGAQNVPSPGIRPEKLQKKEMDILTTAEIKELFELTNKEPDTEKEQVLQIRDRAMLAIFYSCGLRRNEGAGLAIEDINFDTRVLHVKKGKNHRERLVPLNKTNAAHLQEWVYDHRPRLARDKREHRLFINVHGEPMTGGALYKRLKLLLLRSENTALQQKDIGLHSLRHSIATHLLQAGMGLEKIARFLGHSSLESTQIYTHLIEKE